MEWQDYSSVCSLGRSSPERGDFFGEEEMLLHKPLLMEEKLLPQGTRRQVLCGKMITTGNWRLN